VTRLFYRVRCIAAIGTYALLHLVFSLFWVPVVVLFVHGKARKQLFASAMRWSLIVIMRGYLRAMFVYRLVEISGLTRARAAEPAVYVSNHRGRLDGPFILSMIGGAGVVMKASYIKNPFFGPFVRYLDFVSVDADAVSQLAGTMSRSREVLAGGRNLLVFPEGARAPGARMLPFKDTAFRLAQDAGVPVVPVVVHTDVPVMGKKYARFVPWQRFVVRMRFLEPQRAGEGERPADFTARVERMMARELAQMDKGTFWEKVGAGRAEESA
jgi:1-acyl-sn-glycerol-3-phosphate acyltransferase